MSGLSKIFLTMGIIVGVTYCTSTSYIPNEQDIRYARQKWPKTDSAALFKGYRLYKTKCKGCHYLYKPTELTATEWTSSLYDMRLEVDMTKKEYLLIEKYLLTLCCSPDTFQTREQ